VRWGWAILTDKGSINGKASIKGPSLRAPKRCQEGSVENLDEHKNHDVVGEDEQAEVAALTVVGAASDVGTLAPFDHGDDGLHLGPPSIGGPVEALLHEAAVTTGRRLGSGSTELGGNDGP
jgi:hypothetical protein